MLSYNDAVSRYSRCRFQTWCWQRRMRRFAAHDHAVAMEVVSAEACYLSRQAEGIVAESTRVRRTNGTSTTISARNRPASRAATGPHPRTKPGGSVEETRRSSAISARPPLVVPPVPPLVVWAAPVLNTFERLRLEIWPLYAPIT